MAQDPYGIDLALDDVGDLVVWPNGALGVLSGAENCLQALKLRLRTWRGELPLWPDFGSGLPELVGQKLDADILLGQANVELRAIIESDRRFVAVRDLDVNEVDTAVGGQVTASQVSMKLHLAEGEVLSVSDLGNPEPVDGGFPAPEVDELLDPDVAEDVDLGDFNSTIDDLEDAGGFFFSNDQVEVDDLNDAADLTRILEQTPDTGE